MPKVCRSLFLALALVLVGCAPSGPTFGSLAATLPPPPPGTARIYIYRWLEPYETTSVMRAYLNNMTVGVTYPGSVLYADVPPGQYTIKVDSRGAYPNQFKTVTVRAGNVFYARVESARWWSVCGGTGDTGDGGSSGCWDTFVINIIDPAVAQAEMAPLRLLSG